MQMVHLSEKGYISELQAKAATVSNVNSPRLGSNHYHVYCWLNCSGLMLCQLQAISMEIFHHVLILRKVGTYQIFCEVLHPQ